MRKILSLVLLGLLIPTFSSAATCPNLYRNLSFGTKGADVTQLQSFLIEQGHLEAGNNTGYFGRMTEAAVKKFQCREMQICSGSASSNGYGAVGPRTRAQIADICSRITGGPDPIPQSPMSATPQSPSNPTGSNSPSCTPLPPQTQTLSCPTGQTGAIAQTRTSNCPGPVWSAWQTTANTCTPTPPAPLTYNEKYRPQYHFTPQNNFAADPHPIYYDGEYHLFYQYTNFTPGGGAWGHAISKDLLHWEHYPMVLQDRIENGNEILTFSGSVVIDSRNTSGLCAAGGCMIALYTSHVKSSLGDQEYQTLAYSNDRGRTWTRYVAKDPVLTIPVSAFRDPHVFWYDGSQEWVMAITLSLEHKVHFYTSSDLKEWRYRGEYNRPASMAADWHLWEVPNLFEVPIEGTSGKKWVLTFSGGSAQGPEFGGMKYVIGQFDGKTFTADAGETPRVLDHGKDFYAASIVANGRTPLGEPIMMGWVNNFTYMTDLPTAPWKSAESLPRALALRHTSQGLRLVQKPISALESLRGASITDSSLIDRAFSGKTTELLLTIKPKDSSSGTNGGTPNTVWQAGVKVLKDGAQETVVGYDAAKGEVFLDRTRSGHTSFSTQFPSVERAPVTVRNGVVTLRIFIDQSIVEVFVNEGEATITSNVFPTTQIATVETFNTGNASLELKAWEMKRVWK